MQIKLHSLILILSLLLTACGGQSGEPGQSNPFISDNGGSTSDTASENPVTESPASDYPVAEDPLADNESTPADTDLDGIPDTEDAWPNDNTRPKISSLWGLHGELWQADSRLPFVAMAGYREGKEALPVITRVVANISDFGATNSEGSTNDTRAFQDALAHARTQVSVDNPGVLLVPAGVYDVDEQLHLSASGLVLQGEGRDTTRIRFTTGLINDDLAITPEQALRRKLLIVGGAMDASNNLCTGIDWEQWNNSYSAALDLENLPTRGDFSLRLAAPLSSTLKANIINQGYRIRLGQAMGYGEDSDTPLLAASVYGGSDFAPSGAQGGVWMTQQFVVQISEDDQTLTLDRPLRFSPSAETRYGGVRIALRNDDPGCSTEEIGVEHLTIELPATDWLEHFGTEGQGGIDILSDNSWVRDVRLINADNGIEINKNTFNNTITDVILSANRTPRRSGAIGNRYDAYGHHGLTVKGREHMVKDFVHEVSFVHDVTMNNCHGCVVMHGQGDFMNMDHHRQAIYDSVWTDLHLGDAGRMWDSTGNPAEGFNAAAYMTYWNIRSNSPEKASWPQDGGNQPQWGYHKINMVGTEITHKPTAGENDVLYPYPYHPNNAHLEVIDPAEVWPQNIYEAQLEAYKAGRLF